MYTEVDPTVPCELVLIRSAGKPAQGLLCEGLEMTVTKDVGYTGTAKIVDV